MLKKTHDRMMKVLKGRTLIVSAIAVALIVAGLAIAGVPITDWGDLFELIPTTQPTG